MAAPLIQPQNGTVALVTDAASEMGRATAPALAGRGCRVGFEQAGTLEELSGEARVYFETHFFGVVRPGLESWRCFRQDSGT